MKRLLSLSVVCMTSFVGLHAQHVVGSLEEKPEERNLPVAPKVEEDKKEGFVAPNFVELGFRSGDGINYGVGMTIGYKGILLGYNMFIPEDSHYDHYFGLFAGYEHRYYFIPQLYMGARATIGYDHSKYSYSYNKKSTTIKDGWFNFAIEPRAGLDIWKGYGISGGYHWGWGNDSYKSKYWFVSLDFNF